MGKAPNVRRWPGAFTGQRYQFGGDKRTGKVDIRDGVKFVTQRTNGGAERIWRYYATDTST